MKKYLAAMLLSIWSPMVLAHPGHGSIPFGDPWQLLVAVTLIAAVGIIGYLSYQTRKRGDD